MRNKFEIVGLAGKKTLRGEIAVGGAKNAVLKAMAAAVLFEDMITLKNVPDIEDVGRMCELLQIAGCKIEREPGVVVITPPNVCTYELDKTIAGRFRASIVLAGPMLARCGEVSFPFPGGDVFGERPIDLFLDGFKAMGCTVSEDDGYFTVKATSAKLKAAHLTFPFVSVTATETLLLAAVLADGETVLENVAQEPEVGDLVLYLNECGAKIKGVGTSTLRIQGSELLKSNNIPYVTPSDRIEAGSFVLLGALAGEEIKITNCNPAEMGAFLSVMVRAGVELEIDKDVIVVRSKTERYAMPSVRTHEYPGFPTDLQAPMSVFMSQCEGEGSIFEGIFEGRFRYVEDLNVMGADITVMNPHRILIRGPKKLSSKPLSSPDIRAGLAYLIASVVAEGTSTIDNAYVIDRGYAHIEERLQKLGLDIRRI